MRKWSNASWNLNIIPNYLPSIAILIPVYNEEKVIRLKLENISKVVYPKDKMEIIVVNDSSTDNTINEVNNYIKSHKLPSTEIFDSKVHLGKTGCLNKALGNIQADIVIISDVDCFWPHDILLKSLHYLSDVNVGAITAREFLLNPSDNWVTLGEQFYDSTIQAVRIGESKMHSTIFFQGGFAAYRRNLLTAFNQATDDSGTALDVIQLNRRAILIPEIGFFTVSPTAWTNKIAVKVRRASHLQHLWAKCLRLLIWRKLAFPKRIAMPEIILHLFNPIFLVIFIILSSLLLINYPLLAIVSLLLFCGLFIIKKTRMSTLEFMQNNFILLVSLISFLTGRKFRVWKPIIESRSALSDSILRENQLI